MKEKWIMEAEQTAKDLEKTLHEQEQTAKELAEILAKTLYKAITDEADVLGVDRKWYFENVVQFMKAENEV